MCCAESVYKYQTVIDDDDVRLEILDTAGQVGLSVDWSFS